MVQPVASDVARSPKRDFLTRQSSHYDQHRWILALVCSIVQALDTMRIPLTVEVMWNVKVGGNTFFNTLIFRKHLSQMSLLLADLWEAAEWVSPSVQGRMAAFRKGKGQRAFAFIKLVLITPLHACVCVFLLYLFKSASFICPLKI